MSAAAGGAGALGPGRDRDRRDRDRRIPGFLTHVLLLWRLRLAMAANAGGRRRGLAVVSFALAAAPGAPLFAGGWLLMTWPAVARSLLFTRLLYDLMAFVVGCVFLAWPILSAGVDDHSEVARYVLWPVTPLRLLVASTAASVLEPLALVIQAPMLGATLGLLRAHRTIPVLPAMALYLLFLANCAAWSRTGLHLILGVLRRRRSAQTIGGFFGVVLVASFFIPPVDLSWLIAAGGGAGMAPAFVVQAAQGLSRVPTGYLGEGLLELAGGRVLGPLVEAAGLAWFAAVGLYAAWRLLLRFHQVPRTSGAAGRQQRARNPFATTRSALTTLAVREAYDLFRNPRARLLFFVPFVLSVALHLFSARGLVRYLAGPATDAWLLGGLCLYGVVVFGVGFAQNLFGYDGRGLATILASPTDLAVAMRAKNLVHGAAAALLATTLAAYYVLYFGHGGVWDVAAGLMAVAVLLPVLLTVGNFVSTTWPVRFHASLERRDRQPRVAILCGIAAASVGSAPFSWLLVHRGAPGPVTVALLAGCAAVAWGVYRALLPAAEARLRARRERVLLAVSRD